MIAVAAAARARYRRRLLNEVSHVEATIAAARAAIAEEAAATGITNLAAQRELIALHGTAANLHRELREAA